MKEGILNQLDIAIAFFTKDSLELNFFNNNILSLWNLSKEEIDNNPDIITFFEILREKGIFPEKDNFREFCNNLRNKALNEENFEESQNIVLTSGKTILETVKKNNEGTLFIWEDTTDMWNITYSLNTYKNIFQRIIERNPNPILLIASNGLVEDYNSKFLENFNIKADILDNKLHIRNLLEEIPFLTNRDEEKAILIGNILGSKSFNYSFKDDKDIISFNGIALPNGSKLLSFIIANESKENFIEFDSENILKLQNEMIIDLGDILSTPLTNIIGFADLLKNQYIGSLNIKQQQYLDTIIEKAQKASDELSYKIQLTEFEEDDTKIIKENIDLNIIIANLLYHIKSRLNSKNINISLDIAEKATKIQSEETLFNKALILIMLYLIEQNNHNSEITISILQKNNETRLSFKDTSKLPLFSKEDLEKRYDLSLSLKILQKLDYKISYVSKNRSQRVLEIII